MTSIFSKQVINGDIGDIYKKQGTDNMGSLFSKSVSKYGDIMDGIDGIVEGDPEQNKQIAMGMINQLPDDGYSGKIKTTMNALERASKCGSCVVGNTKTRGQDCFDCGGF